MTGGMAKGVLSWTAAESFPAVVSCYSSVRKCSFSNVYSCSRSGVANTFCKGPESNILGFEGHTVFVSGHSPLP